jgi:hypothetical protein
MATRDVMRTSDGVSLPNASGAEAHSDEDSPARQPPAVSSIHSAVLGGGALLLIALLLPYGRLTSQAYIGGGSEQVVRDFSRTVWFWDLSLGAVGLLLVAAVVLIAIGVIGRQRPEAIVPILAACLIALAANTFLAASLADRDWRDTPTPSPLAGTEPTPRCEFTGYGRSYIPLDGDQQTLPLYSCALGLQAPLGELHDEVIAAGYAVPGMPGFRTGIGAQLFVAISFLIAVGAGWALLRRRLPRFAAGLVIALAMGLLYVVALFDAVGHYN